MNIIFFGSDDFAVTNLRGLLKSPHQVLACVTQPDKAKGRHLNLTPSPVKTAALETGIGVLQPRNLRDEDFVQKLQAFEADLFIVIAYGRILPAAILDLPKQFCVNMHASLLPKYRGAAPVNWSIINGEEFTGVSAMKMNEGMDTGDVIFQEKIAIHPEDTAINLRAKLADLSTLLLIRTLDAIETGHYSLQPQDESKVTFAPKLTKELGLISWDKSGQKIHNLVRGLLPWPCAYTQYQNKNLKILETEVVEGDFSSFRAGQVAQINREGFIIATPDQGLLVRRVHLDSAKPMDAPSFIAGHRLLSGYQF